MTALEAYRSIADAPPRPGVWQTIHAYLVVSRTLAALPHAVPFLVGAVIAGLRPWWVAAAICWALLIYSYSCKVNDLADYRWDRFNEGRTRSPILNGVVLPEQVGLWAAVELMILTASATAAPIDWVPKSALLGLIALTTYGNAFQKRSRLIHPIVMDHLFGVAMAAPIVVCAGLGGPVDASVLLLSVSFLYQMVVLNSYSGNLKDLEHDLAVGAGTTAIRLGVRRVGTRTWSFPLAYRAFLGYAQALSTLALIACIAFAHALPTAWGILALLTSVAAAVALARRIKQDTTGIPIDLPPGQSDRLGKYMSRPPHLVLNVAAFLFAAAQLTGLWALPAIVALSLAVPKATLVMVKRLKEVK